LGDCIFTLNADTTVTGTFTAFNALTILEPVKNEVIPAGSTFTIWWGAPANAATFKLKYSLNNGTTWNDVDNGKGVVGNSYVWTVPVPPKTKAKCRIKVVGYNANGNKIGSAISKKFTIAVP
jgi:hypothetical protein